MIGSLGKKYLGATIPVINIYGTITSQTTETLVKRLKNINVSRAVALAVVVNSPGGLPVQSQIITDKLKNYSSKNNLKMYTFARDVAASGGYMVLCGGDHVVADTTSIVGSIGVVFQRMKLKGLMERMDIDHKRFATQNNLLSDIFSPFEELNP
eukprot:TRINITY_DN79551_c0_g1_i1.p1 TRINITY_DN79551_c0_g1~~TRINITY_DN79551_c0_g1_i1.p1  ORF type:complete len:154 (-),score=7.71 TRINITY_DN79551_c0_g1_i1:240-701(-)